MDRRQKKSREAIFRAFRELLQKRRYDHITVQDIIDRANVGRSTFYAHFETKDALLKAMCDSIFEHILSRGGDGATDCAFTAPAQQPELEGRLAHILYHLKDSENDLPALLRGDSGDLFMGYLREQMRRLFAGYIPDCFTAVPRDYLLNHLAGGFTEAVRWWLINDTGDTPEQVARYFLAINPIK